MIRIHLSGPHARRSPFAYPALAPLFTSTIAQVDNPDEADLFLFSHILDLGDMAFDIVESWRKRPRPVVILSEEPFWDTIWGGRPTERVILAETRWGLVPTMQVNHVTSSVFRHDRIPYYLLTNHRFAAAYGARFPQLARRTPHAWREALHAAPWDVTFIFERRPERFHDAAWPEASLFGLCAWRTDLAELCPPDRTERLGPSWQGGPRRTELADWFIDKIVRLDGRARLVGAVENTHHPDYLTEKLFDAFLCGARPIYWAAPDHRIHDLGLAAPAWVNLHGLDATEAAEKALAEGSRAAVTDETTDALHETAVALANLFAAPSAWVAERARLAAALPAELERVLSESPL